MWPPAAPSRWPGRAGAPRGEAGSPPSYLPSIALPKMWATCSDAGAKGAPIVASSPRARGLAARGGAWPSGVSVNSTLRNVRRTVISRTKASTSGPTRLHEVDAIDGVPGVKVDEAESRVEPDRLAGEHGLRLYEGVPVAEERVHRSLRLPVPLHEASTERRHRRTATSEAGTRRRSRPRSGARTLDDRPTFRQADREHIETTPVRIKRLVAEHIVGGARCLLRAESTLVSKEANKKTRHIPVRKLFKDAPHVLSALKPCWAMSPLVVPQLLPAHQLLRRRDLRRGQRR